ncbi:MAG: MFS transporter [Steroidobacteraceae bacterium]|nr:MFS transporter [Steroidobacteraceae bacterium]MCC7198110.1 MFS transporter [Gammaproteobacteria bacterium]
MGDLRKNPWLIAGMGLLVLMVTNGLTATAISVFDESLLKEFGWSRGELKFRDFISFAIVAALAPLGGWLLDKVGARRLLITGLAALAVAYLCYSRIQSLYQMYAIYVLFAAALLMSGTMVVIVLVSSWFVERRGQAVGIALVGTSFGSFVLSPLNAVLIESLGWRNTFALEALIPLTAMVLVILFVRDSPVELGGRPLGVEAGAVDPRQVGLSFGEAIRTRTFWAISCSGFLTYYSILALFNHLFLHMRGLGFEPKVAALALGLLAMLAMAGKLGSGWLADRFDRHRVFMVNIALMFVGVAGLATLRGGWFVWACVFVIGLGWGGLFTLYNMLTVNNFGLKAIGRINGAVSTLEALGGGLGIWLTGRLYDQYGSYGVPFTVLACCVFGGLVIGALIRNELQRSQALAKA